MANSFSGNPIIVDTLAAAVSITPALTGNAYTPLKLYSIEWSIPTNTAHTCLVQNQAGVPIFNEACVVANQSIIKYFNSGLTVGSIEISASGAAHMASGVLHITLK